MKQIITVELESRRAMPERLLRQEAARLLSQVPLVTAVKVISVETELEESAHGTPDIIASPAV